MTDDLRHFVRSGLSVQTPPAVQRIAALLAAETQAAAVLFYGSILRTGDLDGVLDFYILTGAPHRTGLRAWIERTLWPEVSYREWSDNGIAMRAKVATMPLAVFARAAAGSGLDTTIWTRFVQPSALVWSAGQAQADAVVAALSDAAITAANYAATLGPARGQPQAFWRALFRQTYRTELRVERPGRERQIIDANPERYARLLPLAWTAAGVPFTESASDFEPTLSAADRARSLSSWRHRRRVGRALNAARLVKAAFTFQGAARYAAWKIERHTGMAVPLSPWAERHPILAAPGVLWRLWRWRCRQPEAV